VVVVQCMERSMKKRYSQALNRFFSRLSSLAGLQLVALPVAAHESSSHIISHQVEHAIGVLLSVGFVLLLIWQHVGRR